MRDIDERYAKLLLQALELQLHLLSQLEVQRAERFIQQEDARIVDDGAGDGDALLLSAGHAVNLPLFKALQLHRFQRRRDLAAYHVLRQLFDRQTVGDVVIHIHQREKRVILEHGVHRALVRRHAADVLPVDEDGARIRLFKPCEHSQRRRFAAAGRSEQCEELTLHHVEADALDDSCAVEGFCHIFYFYYLLCHIKPRIIFIAFRFDTRMIAYLFTLVKRLFIVIQIFICIYKFICVLGAVCCEILYITLKKVTCRST